MKTSVPLCIDLDGTLLNSDLLLEAAFAQLKQAPLAVLNWQLLDGDSQITVPGALFFSLNPERFLPQSGIQLFRFIE